MFNGARKISSLSHSLVKEWVFLKDRADVREQKGQVLVAGQKLVEELASLGPFETLLVTETYQGTLPVTKELIVVSESVLKKVTGLCHPEGIAAVLSLPRPCSLQKDSWIVAFDAVSDPGNLGTLLRTALAFGWAGAFFLPGCVDLFNEKAIRAAKGASFFLPFQRGSWEDLLELTSAPIFLADTRGEPFTDCLPNAPHILVLGNESRGISPEGRKRGRSLTIPLSNRVDSLNVATAGALFLYFLRHTHGR